jgi:thioredoxin reductase
VSAERLDNYPGFPEGIGGADLAQRLSPKPNDMASRCSAAVAVASLEAGNGGVTVTTATGREHRCRGRASVATGSAYRRTGAEGEADLIGAGIHFCATCDGPFYRGAAEIVVVGGGNSGLEEGLFLTQFAEHVTVVEQGNSLRGSRLLQDKVREHPRMSVRTVDVGHALRGTTRNTSSRCISTVEASTRRLEASGPSSSSDSTRDRVAARQCRSRRARFCHHGPDAPDEFAGGLLRRRREGRIDQAARLSGR